MLFSDQSFSINVYFINNQPFTFSGSEGKMSQVRSGCNSTKDPDEKKFNQTLTELNIQVAQFRDLLLAVGSTKDCPDLRERIRKVRMEAVEDVMRTNNSLLPHVKK